MGSLFEKAGIVHNPRRHRLLLRQGLADVPCRLEPHGGITPLATTDKMQQLVMHVPGLFRICARARRDRLDALALPLTQYSRCVNREGFPLSAVLQMPA